MSIERVRIWFSPSHSSVDVRADGVGRDTSGTDMAAVIRALPEADRAVLVSFCKAVVACAESGDATQLSLVR